MKFILFCISFVSAGYVDLVFRCGRDFNNDICPQNLSCSQYGFCGNTSEYSGVGCQSNCLQNPSTTTLSIMTSTISSNTIPTTTLSTVSSSTLSVIPTKTSSTIFSTTSTNLPTLTYIFKESCNTDKTIALTFDDGPSQYTYDFIIWLSNNKIPATFFIIGNKINSYITTIQQMSRLGFEIGCHTWDHTDLTTLTNAQIRSQISRTNDLIKKVTGKYPKYFRAPYLAYNSKVEAIIREFNMITISVNLDTNDWKYQSTNPELIYKAYTDNLPSSKGFITLQHDRYTPSLDLVPRIVDYIRSQNYRMVTIDECIA